MQERFSEVILLLHHFDNEMDISDDNGVKNPPRLSEITSIRSATKQRSTNSTTPFDYTTQIQPRLNELQNLYSMRRYEESSIDITGFAVAQSFAEEQEFAIFGDEDSVEDPEPPSAISSYFTYAKDSEL